MYFVNNNSNEPYYNLALEEFLFREVEPDTDVVMLWQNAPSVIIGRYQNTIEEINSEYIRENDVYVARRMTGGGAVYHDLGNLNYSIITKKPETDFDFPAMTQPLIRALEKIGVKTELTGRNDVTIEGRKFSGNAQHADKRRLLHHGTIMFNVQLDNVQKALHVKADKIESKSVKSVRSRVCNVSEYLKQPVALDDFSEILLDCLFDGNPRREYKLSKDELSRIEDLANRQNRTWEWNYGKSPRSNVRKRRRLPAGEFEFHLWIEEGEIKELKISGDFFCKTDITVLEQAFVGARFSEDGIRAAMEPIVIEEYFQNVEKDDLLAVLLD